jgi:CheY-like chemotaxis protein
VQLLIWDFLLSLSQAWFVYCASANSDMNYQTTAMNTQSNTIRTLVVDDSLDECALLSFELKSVASLALIGFVHNGLEAIHYLRGTDGLHDRRAFPYPDLMLLDFSMPKCGGMEVLKFLSRQSHRPHVLLWSNTLDQVNVPHALELGADMVRKKPSNRRELIEIMREMEAIVLNARSSVYSSQKPQKIAPVLSLKVAHKLR